MLDGAKFCEQLAAAKANDRYAGDECAKMLFDWTRRALHGEGLREKEDILGMFVEHILREEFSHLPDLDPGRLVPFLRSCLAHFLVDHRRRESTYDRLELPCSQLTQPEGMEPQDIDLDEFPGNAESPEQALLRHEQEKELRSSVAQMSPTNRQIFKLYFEEGLSRSEVASR